MLQNQSICEKSLPVVIGLFLFAINIIASANPIKSFCYELNSIQVSNYSFEPYFYQDRFEVNKYMLQSTNRDLNVDPCEDFYAYACNGWLEENPIPDGRIYWDKISKMEVKNQQIIEKVLAKPVHTFKSESIKKAKFYYQSCIDQNRTIEKLGAQPMLDLLDELGGWNISAKANWSMQDTLQNIQNKYYVDALFTYAVGEDETTPSRHIIQIEQSGLSLVNVEFYVDKEITKAYLEYMTKVALLLGGNLNDTKSQMQDVMKFEFELTKINDVEKEYTVMTLEELQTTAGFINWKMFFNDAMNIINKEVTSKEEIVIYTPEYLRKLTLLIANYEKSEKGRITLKNYFIWQTIKTYIGYLPRAFQDAYGDVKKILTGSEDEDSRWKVCLPQTENAMEYAIGAIFIHDIFDATSKAQAQNMVKAITNTFKANLKNLDWMDAETRKLAEAKADAVSFLIGYPNFIANLNKLDQYYNELTVKNDNYFENNININRFNLMKNLKKLNKPACKDTWSISASTVNAYYTPYKNQLVFPAGVLQSPFFKSNYPVSFNFGRIGAIMGHELTHGFDDQGREYDKDGNFNQWWSAKTKEMYDNKTECFINQYTEYQNNGWNLNGTQTLSENIADAGGLKAAYQTYLTYTKDKGESRHLPGLNLTEEQLFFLGYAQLWCSSETEDATWRITEDVCSPAKYRAIGPLANLEEFSRAYKCPVGSNMNPKKKCKIW